MSGMERMKKAAKGCESCVANLIMPDKLNSQGHAHGGDTIVMHIGFETTLAAFQATTRSQTHKYMITAFIICYQMSRRD